MNSNHKNTAAAAICCITKISYAIPRIGLKELRNVQRRTNHAPMPYLTMGIILSSNDKKSARIHSLRKNEPCTVTVMRSVLETQRWNQFSLSWELPIKNPITFDFEASRYTSGTCVTEIQAPRKPILSK